MEDMKYMMELFISLVNIIEELIVVHFKMSYEYCSKTGNECQLSVEMIKTDSDSKIQLYRPTSRNFQLRVSVNSEWTRKINNNILKTIISQIFSEKELIPIGKSCITITRVNPQNPFEAFCHRVIELNPSNNIEFDTLVMSSGSFIENTTCMIWAVQINISIEALLRLEEYFQSYLGYLQIFHPMMTFTLKKFFDSQDVSFRIGSNLSSGGRKIILPSMIYNKGLPINTKDLFFLLGTSATLKPINISADEFLPLIVQTYIVGCPKTSPSDECASTVTISFLGPDFFPIWSIPKAQDFRDILHMSADWDVSMSSPFIGYEGKTDLHVSTSLKFVQSNVSDKDELIDILLFMRIRPEIDKNNDESRCSNGKKTTHILRKNLYNIITENAPVLQELLIQNFKAALKHVCERLQKQTIVDQTIQQTASALRSILKHSTNEAFTLRCQRYIGCSATYEVEKALVVHLQKIVSKIMGRLPEDQENKAVSFLNNSVLQVTGDVDDDDDFVFLMRDNVTALFMMSEKH
ncbi:uncharacterized protein LOC111089308, partial [Limulus polyphemus]|uniref:Uncharacterized protein LOC111089308 n=1 Tax=Limulus polyphemus TaxID=6850 RepID=A0ABM1TN25_LIMPO